MTVYQVADGHDNEAGFAAIDPQPRCSGIRATRVNHNPDGSVTREGLYVEFEFDIVESATAFQALLTQFGLASATTNEVTVTVRDRTFASVNKNGTAVYPEPGQDVSWKKFFPRNVVILVKDLADT